MHHPIVSLFAMTIFVAGCVTPPEPHGRYLHIYKMGVLVSERDSITGVGCKALTDEINRRAKAAKGLPSGTILDCSAEAAPRSALPVKLTLSSSEDPRTLTMWMWSTADCQKLGSEEIQIDDKRMFTCEVERN